MIKPIEHPVTMDLSNRIYNNKAIIIKKNDTNSHKFMLSILDNSVPYPLTGYSAKIYIEKRDSSKVFLSCMIDDALNGKISSLLTTQSLTCAGLTTAEVTIYGTAGEILTGMSFNFIVSDVVRDDAAIESTNDFSALTEAIVKVDGWDAQFDSKYAGLEAQYATDLTLVKTQQAANVTQLNRVSNNPNSYSNGIISFIDDDARATFRTVWTPFLSANPNFKMGIAVVEDWVVAGADLTLAEIKAFQTQGHEIYSHTKSHDNITTLNIDEQFRLSQIWMQENGLLCNDILVYPGGSADIPTKNVARKYYKYALNTVALQNIVPVDNWYVNRIFFENNTLAQNKALVDACLLNNTWIVFGSHSHTLINNPTAMAQMQPLIDYITSKGIAIMPFKQASELKGNSIAIGEFTSENSIFVGMNGVPRVGVSPSKVKCLTDSDYNNMDAPITDYPFKSITTKSLSTYGDIFKGLGGIMTVYLMGDASYNYATFVPNNLNEIYTRQWRSGAWTTWTKISPTTPPIAVTGGATGGFLSNPISNFPISTVYVCSCDNGTTNTPTGFGGVYTVYRMPDDTYSYSSYKVYNSDSMYHRRWNGTTWTAWVKVSAV